MSSRASTLAGFSTSISPPSNLSVGIVTAVSFVGDGSGIDLSANPSLPVSGIGINTEGGSVGTGATVLDFRGTGISTVTVASGVGTIFIEGGGGGGGGASVTTSDTAPTSPSDGDLWYDSVGGRLYVYYEDPNSSQWVDAAPQGGGDAGFSKLEVGNTKAEIIDTGSDGRFVVTTEGTGRMTVDSSGRTLLGGVTANANGGVLQLSSGITFPATAVAATDPNTLDDYEEGTWTPSLGGNATYTSQTGFYTKIGRVVTVHFILTVNTIGTGSVTVISGLPFACSQNAGGACDYYGSLASSLVHITPRVDTLNTTLIKFRTLAAASATMGDANIFQSGTRVDGTITYIT